MNNVVMIGRLTKDPDLRYAGSNNTALCKFLIAVDRPFAKKEDKTKADFFNVSVWGKIAETCSKHLKKGRKVGIQGRFQNNDYTDKDGVKRYTVELVAEQVDIIDWGDKVKNEESTIIEENIEE